MNKEEKFVIEEKLNQEFIFEFIKLRHNLGLTQQQMANKSNVLRDKIAKIEAGIYPPNIKSLFKILGPLGYTIKIEKIDNKNSQISVENTWLYYGVVNTLEKNNIKMIEEIKNVIISSRNKVAYEVNKTMLLAYWNVGRTIVENEQNSNIKNYKYMI